MDNKRYDLTNVLVTGASGNLGKIICLILKKQKISFKKLSSFHKKKKFPLEISASVFELSKYLKPSLIIHSAIDDKKSPNLNKNLMMIKNLIRYFNVPIIYISSVSVYSGLNKKYLSESITKYKLNTKYSLVKRRCEETLLSRKFNNDLCLRIPGIFFNKRKDGLIYNLLNNYKKKNYKIKFFDLHKQWQFIHNKHFEVYFSEILNMKKLKYNIINVGYKDWISVLKVIKILNKKFSKKKKILLKNKTNMTKLNLKRLGKITKNKLFTLNEGIELLIK